MHRIWIYVYIPGLFVLLRFVCTAFVRLNMLAMLKCIAHSNALYTQHINHFESVRHANLPPGFVVCMRKIKLNNVHRQRQQSKLRVRLFVSPKPVRREVNYTCVCISPTHAVATTLCANKRTADAQNSAYFATARPCDVCLNGLCTHTVRFGAFRSVRVGAVWLRSFALVLTFGTPLNLDLWLLGDCFRWGCVPALGYSTWRAFEFSILFPLPPKCG